MAQTSDGVLFMRVAGQILTKEKNGASREKTTHIYLQPFRTVEIHFFLYFSYGDVG